MRISAIPLCGAFLLLSCTPDWEKGYTLCYNSKVTSTEQTKDIQVRVTSSNRPTKDFTLGSEDVCIYSIQPDSTVVIGLNDASYIVLR